MASTTNPLSPITDGATGPGDDLQQEELAELQAEINDPDSTDDDPDGF